MGISGLLPMLKDIQRRVHVKEYAGKRLAVDAYVRAHLRQGQQVNPLMPRGSCYCTGLAAQGHVCLR